MNVSIYLQTAYENIANWTLGESKPNSNPIKPNLRKAQMNVNLTLTKDYRKKDDFVVRKNKPNSNPISATPKMNVNLYVIKEYENETAFRPQKKQTQNKPNLVRRRRIANAHKALKGVERKKEFQELFLALNCRKGYNIMLSKRKFQLVPECRSRGS